MKKTALLLFLLPALLLRADDDNLSSAVGYFHAALAAGTGTARKVTAYSPPLVFVASDVAGLSAGAITAFTAGTVTVSGAGWTPGALSAPATPFALKITGGAAAGRVFPLSTGTANTADTVTLAPGHADLTALGVAPGDTFELLDCDTLGGLFGTPPTTGVLGGATAAAADNVTIAVAGVTQTYYFNTTRNRWERSDTAGTDFSDLPLPPDAGILYGRLAATPLDITVIGRVPEIARVAEVKNSGTTILAHNWPADITLAASGIAQIPGWVSGSSAASSDKVGLYVNGTLSTYWYDGINWRRQTLGSPVSNGVVISAGTAVTLEKVGAAAGLTALTQSLPYPLN